MEQQVIQLEREMWEAALHRDAEAFGRLVLPDAVMICGGHRCSGREYAELLTGFSINGYSISGMEAVGSGEDQMVLHYVIRVDVEDDRDWDLAGLFHIVSVWKKSGGTWGLVFNMDSRIAGGKAKV